MKIRAVLTLRLGEEVFPCPGDRRGYESPDAEFPFLDRDVGFESEVQHRKSVDQMLPRRESLVAFIEDLPLLSAAPGPGPLFFSFG